MTGAAPTAQEERQEERKKDEEHRSGEGGPLSPPEEDLPFASLEPLIAPRSVAVIGASDDPTRIGGRPLAYMRARGFRGALYPVNPKRNTVQGLPAYARLADLPEIPDAAIIAVPAPLVAASLEELGALGVKGAIVLSAGFAEVDEAGAAAQADLAERARRFGMRLLGPNCLGLFNDRIGFYPTFSSSFETGYPLPGRIGIVSQSGAFGTHIFAIARNRGLGTPLCITTGNEADVTVGDVIGWLAHDPGIDVIVAYAEGINRPARLLAALAAARAARKPVIMMKVGRSALGAEAARSHTASLAGDDRVMGAVLEEFGVLRARTTEEMLDFAYAATKRLYPVSATLGVITVSGGAGVMISDYASEWGLAMPPLPAPAQAALKALVPFSAPRNPVDCTAQVFNDPALVGRFAEAVAEAGYGAMLAFFSQTGGAASIAPHLRAELGRVRQAHPEMLSVLSVIADRDLTRAYEEDGFLVFEDPARAVAAIAAMSRLRAAFAASPPAPPPPLPLPALPPSLADEKEAKDFLAELGFPVPPGIRAKSAAEAAAAAERLGFPVVLKLLSPDIPHKSDIGGVLLGIETKEAARAGFAELEARRAARAPAARPAGVLVERMVKGGVECLMGLHYDPVFGPVAAFGLGGIFVEVFADVVFRRCPFGLDAAKAMIHKIRGAQLLEGARGRPKADIEALAALLSRLSALGAALGPRLAAIDLNPVFALPEGAVIGDALIALR
jgi:acyl-CoA synthetase (NDP forming)